MFTSKLSVDAHYDSGACNISEENDIEQFSNDEHNKSLTEPSDTASNAPEEGAQTPPFLCAACGECFADYEQLTLHHCSQSYKQIFSCDTCGKSFRSRISLSSHVKVHLKKQFTCEICDKSFTTHSHLITHMRTHTGTKPYSCDQCGKSFSQRGTLVRHMVVHSDKKPFTCRSCYKHFSDRHTYVLHLQAHLIMK